MRQTILAFALLAASAVPAAAQGMTVAGVEGNWACRALVLSMATLSQKVRAPVGQPPQPMS